MATTAPPGSLPFVSANADGTKSYWTVRPTGNIQEDQETGDRYAADLRRYMRENDAPQTLAFVVQAMPGHERWSGIETAFFHHIACAARQP